MDVRSDTRSRVGAVPIKDKDGRSLLVVISKYTFSVDPSGKVDLDADKGVDPYLVGEDPATSSIRKPSDLAYEVPGTQVLLVGHAHPPLRGSGTHVDVSLRVGPIAKTVRAHGLRVWQKGLLAGITPAPAWPLRQPVPLIYELAWGGLRIPLDLATHSARTRPRVPEHPGAIGAQRRDPSPSGSGLGHLS